MVGREHQIFYVECIDRPFEVRIHSGRRQVLQYDPRFCFCNKVFEGSDEVCLQIRHPDMRVRPSSQRRIDVEVRFDLAQQAHAAARVDQKRFVEARLHVQFTQRLVQIQSFRTRAGSLSRHVNEPSTGTSALAVNVRFPLISSACATTSALRNE